MDCAGALKLWQMNYSQVLDTSSSSRFCLCTGAWLNHGFNTSMQDIEQDQQLPASVMWNCSSAQQLQSCWNCLIAGWVISCALQSHYFHAVVYTSLLLGATTVSDSHQMGVLSEVRPDVCFKVLEQEQESAVVAESLQCAGGLAAGAACGLGICSRELRAGLEDKQLWTQCSNWSSLRTWGPQSGGWRRREWRQAFSCACGALYTAGSFCILCLHWTWTWGTHQWPIKYFSAFVHWVKQKQKANKHEMNNCLLCSLLQHVFSQYIQSTAAEWKRIQEIGYFGMS